MKNALSQSFLKRALVFFVLVFSMGSIADDRNTDDQNLRGVDESLEGWNKEVNKHLYSTTEEVGNVFPRTIWLRALRNLRRGAPLCYCSAPAGNGQVAAEEFSLGIPIGTTFCNDDLVCAVRVSCVVPTYPKEELGRVVPEGCTDFEFIYRDN